MRKFFKQVLHLVVSVVIATASIQLGGMTDQAEAKQFTVSGGSTFNNPYGTTAQRHAILNKIHSAIDHAPKDSVIRIATYSLKYEKSADKLIAAHKRGVKVQVITSDHYFDQEDEAQEARDTKQLRRLQNALGTTVVYDGSKSFVKICSHSCSSDKDFSTVHSKIYMFSTTGASKRVSMISSSNLSVGHAYAWNNLYTVVGNQTMYDALYKNFYDMAHDPRNANLYQNIAVSDSIRLYTFPRDTEDIDDDVHYTMLEKVRCSGAASGYGSGGKTVIDYAMFKWTDNRSKVAEKLRSLADSGCRVRVITDKVNMGTEVLRVLTNPKSGKASPIIVKNATTTKSGQLRYMHHKYITINGYYVDPAFSDAENRKTKIIFTGSPNLTSSGLRYNNEVMIRLRSGTQYSAFTKNFNLIWNKYSTAFKYVDPN